MSVIHAEPVLGGPGGQDPYQRLVASIDTVLKDERIPGIPIGIGELGNLESTYNIGGPIAAEAGVWFAKQGIIRDLHPTMNGLGVTCMRLVMPDEAMAALPTSFSRIVDITTRQGVPFRRFAYDEMAGYQINTKVGELDFKQVKPRHYGWVLAAIRNVVEFNPQCYDLGRKVTALSKSSHLSMLPSQRTSRRKPPADSHTEAA